MGERSRAIGLVAAILVLLGIGAYQGARVQHLRDDTAFYRWVMAAGTNDRLFSEDRTGEYLDRDLLAETAGLADPLLSDTAPGGNAVDIASDLGATKLARMVGDVENSDEIWRVISSEELEPLRDKFLDYSRGNKLSFVEDIGYAQAGESGVSVFNLFFGFRKIAASLLWIEVDRNWRRGFIYRVVPMMKTVVALDPNFIDAYLMGSWQLAYNETAKMTSTPPALLEWNEEFQACVGPKEEYYYVAADFLKNGIRHNPRDYRLYFDLGFGIYDEKIEDYSNAVLYLREATRQPHERWVPRMLYRALEKNGQYQDALDGWNDYLANFTDNQTDTAQRFITRNTALLHEQESEAIRIRMQDETDPTRLAELEDKRLGHLEAARATWESIASEEVGQARLLRLEAIELAGQGRYHEAVALLDHARWKSGEIFTEASDMIIDYKQAGGIQLSVSEKKAVLRQQDGGCTGAPGETAKPAA